MLWGLTVQSIAWHFERWVLQCRYNDLGAVQLEAETQALLAACEDLLESASSAARADVGDGGGGGSGGGGVGSCVGDSGAGGVGATANNSSSSMLLLLSARTAFRRLQQMCYLLNLEQATDLYDSYVYDPGVLTCVLFSLSMHRRQKCRT